MSSEKQMILIHLMCCWAAAQMYVFVSIAAYVLFFFDHIPWLLQSVEIFNYPSQKVSYIFSIPEFPSCDFFYVINKNMSMM